MAGGTSPPYRPELTRPNLQPPEPRLPPRGWVAPASPATPAHPERAGGPGRAPPSTPVIRTAGGPLGLTPSRKPLPPPPPPRLDSSSRAGAGAGRLGAEWARGRGTRPPRCGPTAGRSAGYRAASTELVFADRRLLAPGGRQRRHFRDGFLHVDLGNARGRGLGVRGQHLPGCRDDRGRATRAPRPMQACCSRDLAPAAATRHSAVHQGRVGLLRPAEEPGADWGTVLERWQSKPRTCRT